MIKKIDSKTLARALLLKLRASMAVQKDRELIKKHLTKGKHIMKTITVANTHIKARINSKKWTYAETNWSEGITAPRNESKLQVTVYHILNVPDDVTLQIVRDMYDAIPMRMTPFFFQNCLSFGIEYAELLNEYNGHRTSIHVKPISASASKEFYGIV